MKRQDFGSMSAQVAPSGKEVAIFISPTTANLLRARLRWMSCNEAIRDLAETLKWAEDEMCKVAEQ